MAFAINKYNMNQLQPGMELGRPVFNRKGTILLAEGTILSEALLARLRSMGIQELDVRDPQASGYGVVLLDKQHLPSYMEAVHKVKDIFNVVKRYDKIPLLQVKELAGDCIMPLVDVPSAINYLNLDRAREEYIYSHCVNVALLSGTIGKWLGYSQEEINELVIAGLLHDVGKTQIPVELLNKPSGLTTQEMQLMQLHSTYSYSLINKTEGLSKNVLYGILQHHERLDGSGYPGKFGGSKIHQFARIVAIADIYDAMTSNRAYRDKVTPFQAVEALTKDMFSKLDVEICTTFLGQFRYFILGNVVELSDGREGEIVYFGEFLNSSPIIRCSDGDLIKLTNWHNIEKVKPLNF